MCPPCQVVAELWRFPDRTTATGLMIDSYLQSKTELDDAAVHLLFSANRWEKRLPTLSLQCLILAAESQMLYPFLLLAADPEQYLQSIGLPNYSVYMQV